MENVKSKDLRIGNLLHDRENRLCKVEEIKEDYFYAPAIKGGMTGLPNNVIHITPAWLLRFGFEKETEVIDGMNSYDYYLEIGNTSFNCEWTTRGTLDFVYLEGFDIKVLFVHELQNLHFAITGEELIMKDKPTLK